MCFLCVKISYLDAIEVLFFIELQFSQWYFRYKALCETFVQKLSSQLSEF